MTRWSGSDAPRGTSYDERFERLAAAGHDVHGEASFVAGYGPGTVLDAGCGTGRVAVELARRGIRTVGVDLDPSMLEQARAKTTDVRWVLGDLADLQVERRNGEPMRFHVVVAAGNVMIFLQPGTERRVVERLAAHLVPGGLLIAGFQLVAGRYGLDAYDAHCAVAGLEPFERFSTWARDPWLGEGGYAVSVHRRPVEDDGEVGEDEEPVS
jgi:SAM-dependent methyltransferase